MSKERKERKREQRREQILDAAQRLIAADGYDNVTMQEIADAVDISKGSLYLNFRDKDDITDVLVGRALDELDLIVEEELGVAGLALEKLERLAHAYWRFFMEKPDSFPNLSIISHIAARLEDRGKSSALAERLKRLESILGRTLEEGVREGSIRDSLSIPLLVGLIPILVNTFMEKLATLPRTPNPILGFGSEDLIREFFDILLFYIKGAEIEKTAV
jgi:TetR/AcrR family transcriptional regulator